MNGYFQLITKADLTGIMIYAPKDGGTAVGVNEVIDYLQSKNVVFDLAMVSKTVAAGARQDSACKLNATPHMAEREMSMITISPNKMEVRMRCYPPTPGGERMTTQEICKDLFHRGVRVGIDEEAIKDFVQNPKYCTDIIVARGIPERQGADGYVEYLFNTDNHPHPTQLPDGSVDFFNMNILNLCATGEKLAILHPADPGNTGKNVLGEIIKPREVRSATLKYGHNIRVSEDQMTLISEVDGHVSLTDGRVFVSNVVQFENVDISTGNVEFEGSIEIKGNVATNFKVKAGGNVTINGIVEGAEIEAGGNIVIAKGMNGKGRGVLKAGGDIIVKFLENVQADAGGYISAETILHSNVTAGTEIIVNGRKAFISGGHATAGRLIKAKNLGSDLANDTVLQVGVDPATKRLVQDLKKQKEALEKSIGTIQPVLAATTQKISQGGKLTPDQLQNIQKLTATYKEQAANLAQINEELDKLQADTVDVDDKNVSVVVEGTVYPGTVIRISEVSMTVKKPVSYCRFIKDRGDVRTSSI